MNRIALIFICLLGLLPATLNAHTCNRSVAPTSPNAPPASPTAQPLLVTDLLTEYASNPIGLSPADPIRLCWKIISNEQNVLQTAYEIKVSAEGKTIWSSSKISSSQSTHVPYKGPAIASRTRYAWQVRIWDNHDHVSPWSQINFWETGLSVNDWSAKWITPATNDTTEGPAPYFRKDFTVAKKIRSARLYITAHGIYEASLNGHRVSDAYFTPGWTNYKQRLQYQAYDVTSLIKTGANTAAAIVGDGWYRGPTYRGKRRGRRMVRAPLHLPGLQIRKSRRPHRPPQH